MTDDHTLERDLAALETTLRSLDTDDLELVDPPSDLWDAIAASIPDLVDTPATAPAVASLDQHRRRRFTSAQSLMLAAAAVVLFVVGVVAVTGTRGDDPTVLATAELLYDADAFDPLGADAAAVARLVERDGRFEIVLDDTVLPDVDAADLELWLIEADAAGTIVDVAPVSLIDGAGTYAVPADLDVTTHRVVDISIEPRDGDETHSGKSILRGALTT